jgi:hypothetical protein
MTDAQHGAVHSLEGGMMRLGFGEVLVIVLTVALLGIGIPVVGGRRSKRRIALGGGSMAAVVTSATYLALVVAFGVRAAILGTFLGIIIAVVAGYHSFVWLRFAIAANKAAKSGVRL